MSAIPALRRPRQEDDSGMAVFPVRSQPVFLCLTSLGKPKLHPLFQKGKHNLQKLKGYYEEI